MRRELQRDDAAELLLQLLAQCFELDGHLTSHAFRTTVDLSREWVGCQWVWGCAWGEQESREQEGVISRSGGAEILLRKNRTNVV